jgi:hypothetical protein
MPVIKQRMPSGEMSIELTDESGTPVAVVSAFLAYLSARDCSPNTIVAYAHDLAHLWRFLSARQIAWHELRPLHTVEFLQFLRSETTLHRSRRTGPRLAVVNNGELRAALAASTINRILAAIPSFINRDPLIPYRANGRDICHRSVPSWRSNDGRYSLASISRSRSTKCRRPPYSPSVASFRKIANVSKRGSNRTKEQMRLPARSIASVTAS